MTDASCQVVVMGATNRPQDVDRAICRRMPCTFHVGLPVSSENNSRMNGVCSSQLQMISNLSLMIFPCLNIHFKLVQYQIGLHKPLVDFY